MSLDRRGFLASAAAAALAACGVRDGTVAGRRGSTPTPSAPNLSDPRGSGSPGRSEAASETSPDQDLADARGSVELAVLCREAWGAQPAGPGLQRHTITGMMLHHTAVPLRDDSNAPARLRQHQRYHQEAGWPDIAYHLAVDRRGTVYELRTATARGDTFTDYDPTGWLLVTCEGDFDQQEPTPAQVEAAARACAWGAASFGLDPGVVAAHRDHAATSCPGDALYARLPALGRRAAELAGSVTRRDVCGEEAAAQVAAIEAGRPPAGT